MTIDFGSINSSANFGYGLHVAAGKIPGVSIVHKYGRNPDIDSGFETLWNGGGDYTGFDATGEELVTVVSTSTADDEVGTGAQMVVLYGLDVAGVEISEEVILDGTTPVDSDLLYWRLHRIKCTNVGSGGVNAGVITVRQKVTTANIFAVLPIGYGSSMIAAYTIPAGKTGYFESWFAAFAGKVKSISVVRLNKREQGKSFQVLEEQALMADGSSTFPRDYKTPKNGLVALTDIFVTADSDTANVGIAGGFDLLLVDN